MTETRGRVDTSFTKRAGRSQRNDLPLWPPLYSKFPYSWCRTTVSRELLHSGCSEHRCNFLQHRVDRRRIRRNIRALVCPSFYLYEATLVDTNIYTSFLGYFKETFRQLIHKGRRKRGCSILMKFQRNWSGFKEEVRKLFFSAFILELTTSALRRILLVLPSSSRRPLNSSPLFTSTSHGGFF